MHWGTQEKPPINARIWRQYEGIYERIAKRVIVEMPGVKKTKTCGSLDETEGLYFWPNFVTTEVL